MELEPNLPSDISAYESCYGISTPVDYITVDGGPGSAGAGSGEAALDIEIAAGLAPDATIDVYQAPNTSSIGMQDIFSAFVTNDDEATLSVSWGRCEEETAPADLNAQENLAYEAATQGQTILASAGDAGSTDCFIEGVDPNNDLSVDAPAVTPYIVSVGGTGIDSSGNEVTWNESGTQAGSGGGGLSAYWCMPDYQYQPSIPGIFDGQSATYPACQDSTDTQGYVRETPDVSANADPYSGYVIYLDGGWQGGWGGTSAAAPLWAAIAAPTNASPFCSDYASGNAGVWPPALYAEVSDASSYIYQGSPPEVLRDVTSGTNDYTPSGYTGGLYPAGTGYDLASGLGAPIVAGIAPSGSASTFYPGYTAWACEYLATQLTSSAVTGVSPSSGTAGKSATVTVRGNGFLPITGAERIEAYSGSTLLATLTASCTSTACTVTLPAESAKTVDLRVSVEDGPLTATSASDRYTYVNPPHVTSISPTHGTKNGGTTVTIKGTYFAGVKFVTFGGKPGTHLTVSGTGLLTVVAPSGTEGATVKVVITAAYGTSNSVGYLYADTPHISSISPTSGTHLGGTRITIKGSNFAGVKSVTFGGKAGTHLTVSSTGTLTVLTPSGTKGVRVKVVIIAAGGTSNALLYLYT
jgi:hypothetical protein